MAKNSRNVHFSQISVSISSSRGIISLSLSINPSSHLSLFLYPIYIKAPYFPLYPLLSFALSLIQFPSVSFSDVNLFLIWLEFNFFLRLHNCFISLCVIFQFINQILSLFSSSFLSIGDLLHRHHLKQGQNNLTIFQFIVWWMNWSLFNIIYLGFKFPFFLYLGF